MSDVKIKALTRLFKRAHLGGLLGECILKETKNGENFIGCVDLTNSIILTVFAKTGFKGFDKLGLGDLGIICKYLETADDETSLEVNDNRLVFKNTNGTFKYLLSQPDLIPTSLDDTDALINLTNNCTHEVTLTEKFAKNFAQSMALTKTNNVFIVVGENVNLFGGLDSEHQFRLKIGKSKVLKESKREGKFSVSIYGYHFGAVLNVVDFSVRENYPSLLIKEGKPIVIKQGKDCWALTIVENKEK